jgi:Amt family ammonium transporter
VITPAAGFVGVMSSIAMGLMGGVICFFAVSVLKTKLGYDDSLDAFGVHGIGGTFGAIATGLFASKEVNSAGADGLFFGNPDQLLTQLVGVGTSWVFAAVMTFVIVKVVGMFMTIVADADQEIQGIDISEHGERGYAYQDLITGTVSFSVSSPALEETAVRKTTLA